MKYFEPQYPLPSVTHIAGGNHFTTKKMLLKLFTKVEFFAYTTENWTSLANDAYMSLTCHFTTSKWDMVTCILATSPFRALCS